ncbi:MAG: cryptochrome/photolyase family protein, partial [Sulfurimonas sp.]|nr:cryptochrome/photolyase family protein [Sulfurimonas sp.]
MIFILFPHQLFRNIAPLVGKRVLLVEDALFFTQYPFHVQKNILHRASMKNYEKYLLHKGIEVEYIEDESALACYKNKAVTCYDVVDFDLHKKLTKQFASLEILPNPNFLNAQESTNLLHTFYIAQRKKLNLFVDSEQKPYGGKWSFDVQNRKKIPKDMKIVPPLCFDNDAIEEAKKYAKKFDTIGSCEDFYYPTTFMEAKIVFEYFLEQKFAQFGDYQDAITQKDSFLFHANISSALNIGLLDLCYVIKSIAAFVSVPFNAKEGLLRQIIG